MPDEHMKDITVTHNYQCELCGNRFEMNILVTVYKAQDLESALILYLQGFNNGRGDPLVRNTFHECSKTMHTYGLARLIGVSVPEDKNHS